MKSYPRIMSGPEVRATLAGRKTRISLLPTMANSLLDGGPVNRKIWAGLDWGTARIYPRYNLPPYFLVTHPSRGSHYIVSCRYQPGDRLWVRETFGIGAEDITYYRAKHPEIPRNPFAPGYKAFERWAPPILMPKWASRLTLEVISTGAELVGDITMGDVQAEGIVVKQIKGLVNTPAILSPGGANQALTHFQKWKTAWNARHPKRPFSDNPPCWPITYRVVGK